MANARRLVDAGARAVKLEGGVTKRAQIEAIVAAGIPVMGHIGMLPQSVREEGGYKIKGRTASEARPCWRTAARCRTPGRSRSWWKSSRRTPLPGSRRPRWKFPPLGSVPERAATDRSSSLTT